MEFKVDKIENIYKLDLKDGSQFWNVLFYPVVSDSYKFKVLPLTIGFNTEEEARKIKVGDIINMPHIKQY